MLPDLSPCSRCFWYGNCPEEEVCEDYYPVTGEEIDLVILDSDDELFYSLEEWEEYVDEYN